MNKNNGFTLIELMIVVAIIGIITAIASIKFSDLVRKANEGSTKGNLGAIRSAVNIYYGDQEGMYPHPTASGRGAGSLVEVLTMQNGKYMREVPPCYCPPYHGKTSNVSIAVSTGDESAHPGHFAYKNADDGIGRQLGEVWVNCTHTDSKNTSWALY